MNEIIKSELKSGTILRPLRLYDNSRISDFKRCPRYFLYRHGYDWTPVIKAVPLIFGSSWHSGMDVVWTNHAAVKKDFGDIAKAAYEAFIKTWVENGMNHPEEMSIDDIEELGARTPQNAQEMLYEYIDARQQLFKEPSFELLAIEEPFAVPLDPNDDSLWYVGRLDKQFAYRRHVIAGEHKTSSAYKKDGFFRNDFVDSFNPNSQIDGYNYRMRMKYGEKSQGVWIDAALVHKTVHDGFKLIPINPQDQQIDAFLWEAHYWIDQIEAHKAILKERSELDTPYLAAFPKNTSSCSNYGGCPFADICRTTPNPAKLKGVPPLGYKLEHWSPFNEIALESIGFTPEKAGEPERVKEAVPGEGTSVT